MTTTEQIKRSDLQQFTGTEQWYKLALSKLIYTDGAKYVADRAGAYWLLDLIASHQHRRSVSKEGFQEWTLKRTVCENGHQYEAFMTDGNSHDVIARQKIEYTDFPFDSIGDEFSLWLVDGVILLPTEY